MFVKKPRDALKSILKTASARTSPTQTSNTQNLTGIHATAFLREMDLAYGAADLVISRAGALSMSEIAVCGKPSLLVPSPNVTDDHQTKNALQFSDRGAAIVIRDHDVAESLISSAIAILNNPVKLYEIRAALTSIAKPQATNSIIQEINKLLQS
jgi:UDP-N-acetylglucosamine--N-acetylmuramyl-(pentapeptide) pyrophosphoryl-undecaprenol N-acetylglucosamine transferase